MEAYLENDVQVFVVEAFFGHLPLSVVYQVVIYTLLVSRMVLLLNQIERLVYLQHVSFENVDHVQRVVSSPSHVFCCNKKL